MGGIRRQVLRFSLSTLGILLLLGGLAADADAGISFVKDLGIAGDVTALSTSLSLTLTAGVVAGNTVIVSFAMDPSTGAVTCSDTKGNTYTVDVEIPNGSLTTGVRTVVCSSSLGTALVSGDRIIISHPAAAARAMSATEFTGIAGPGRLDQIATNTGNSGSPNVGPTATTTTASELLIGTFGVETKKDEPFTPDAPFIGLPGASSGNSGGPTSHVSVDPSYTRSSRRRARTR